MCYAANVTLISSSSITKIVPPATLPTPIACYVIRLTPPAQPARMVSIHSPLLIVQAAPVQPKISQSVLSALMIFPVTSSPAPNVRPATTFTITEINARAVQLVLSRTLLVVPTAHMIKPKILSSAMAAPMPTI